MATEKQLAANKKNAAKSGGPHSHAGKRRASQNSFRHGLSRPATLGRLDEDWIEQFAHAATRGYRTLVTLELGRSAAAAHLDLLRVRQARAAMVDQLNTALDKRRTTTNAKKERRDAINLGLLRLNRLDRYERRAAWARNKALRQIWAAARAARPDGS